MYAFACMSVCVCMHVCMHACMHVCMYMYLYLCNSGFACKQWACIHRHLLCVCVHTAYKHVRSISLRIVYALSKYSANNTISIYTQYQCKCVYIYI